MSQAAANRDLVLAALTRCVGNIISLAARLEMNQSTVERAIILLKVWGLIEPIDPNFEGKAYEELWRVKDGMEK